MFIYLFLIRLFFMLFSREELDFFIEILLVFLNVMFRASA